MKLDLMVMTVHPDDAELGAGGTMAKYVAEGKKVGIIDLTEGELGTRGTAETRKQEALKAAEILGVRFDVNHIFSHKQARKIAYIIFFCIFITSNLLLTK